MADTTAVKGKWRTVDLAYTALFAVLMTVCAWISVPLPVPFTLQTFAICAAMGVLGGRRSTWAVAVYLLLGAVGLYQPLVEFAGAGATVPLTGFGNTLAKGVKEAIQEDGFLGILTGGLKASAGGITAAILAGLIASLLFKAKDKS